MRIENAKEKLRIKIIWIIIPVPEKRFYQRFFPIVVHGVLVIMGLNSDKHGPYLRKPGAGGL